MRSNPGSASSLATSVAISTEPSCTSWLRPITSVISPFTAGLLSSSSQISRAEPRRNSSCTFVISRARTRGRLLYSLLNSRKVSRIRCGLSYATTVPRSFESEFRNLRRSPALDGRNPTNRNSSVGSPEAANAARIADGPGTGTTAKPSSIAALTTRYPGSETRGVPASLTRATDSPARRFATISAERTASLCSW